MQRQMAWSRALMERCERLFGGFEFSGGGVETVHHDLVATEIRGERVTVGAIELDAMRVWSFLLFARTGAYVLFDVTCRTQTAITLNRQHGDVSASVVRQQQTLAAIINDEMTRIGALRRLLVEKLERKRFAIDPERAHRSRRCFVDGV